MTTTDTRFKDIGLRVSAFIFSLPVGDPQRVAAEEKVMDVARDRMDDGAKEILFAVQVLDRPCAVRICLKVLDITA